MNQRGQQAVGVMMIIVGCIGVLILLYNIVTSDNFPSFSQFMASTTTEFTQSSTTPVTISDENKVKSEEIFISNPIKEVVVPKGKIAVEISNTPSTREKGLSDRKYLNTGTGMLFIFPTPGMHTFWMKDMNFPLDIVWINSDRKVVGISSNISPFSYPATFKPDIDVQFVLEINAREANLFGIATGTILKF